MNRGHAKLNISDYTGAMNDINYSLTLDPQNPYAYNYLTLVYEKLKDFKTACLNWEKAQLFGMDASENINKYCKGIDK